MLKKVIAGFLVFAASTVFGMSLNKLNSASKAELMEINGIGEAKASAIIKERKKGKFKSFEDFQRVEGIGKETAKNVKNDVKMKKEPKSSKKTTKKKSKSSKKSTKKKTDTKKKK
jgi:competence protein ComEA